MTNIINDALAGIAGLTQDFGIKHRMSVNRGKSRIGKYRCGRFHQNIIAEKKDSMR